MTCLSKIKIYIFSLLKFLSCAPVEKFLDPFLSRISKKIQCQVSARSRGLLIPTGATTPPRKHSTASVHLFHSLDQHNHSPLLNMPPLFSTPPPLSPRKLPLSSLTQPLPLVFHTLSLLKKLSLSRPLSGLGFLHFQARK